MRKGSKASHDRGGRGQPFAPAAVGGATPRQTRYWQQRLSSRLHMHFRGIGTAKPPARYTKAQCLEAFERSAWFARLDARSHTIARLVLQRDNGIESRHLALDTLDEVFEIDPDTLDRRFLAHAPALAAEAAEKALAAAGARLRATSTPSSSAPAPAISAPGSRATSSSGSACDADIQAFDLVGQGCAAALPNLQLGRSLLARGKPRSMCSRSASRSAAPRCTSTTIRAS